MLGLFNLIVSPYTSVTSFTPLQPTPQPDELLYVKGLVMKALSISISQRFLSSCLRANVSFPVLSQTHHMYVDK